jgi:hypothetical protein
MNAAQPSCAVGLFRMNDDNFQGRAISVCAVTSVMVFSGFGILLASEFLLEGVTPC